MIKYIEKIVIIKWHIKGYENYVFGEDKCLYNLKTNRKLNPTYNCRCMGYWIDRKFISLTRLRTVLFIPKSDCPF